MGKPIAFEFTLVDSLIGIDPKVHQVPQKTSSRAIAAEECGQSQPMDLPSIDSNWLFLSISNFCSAGIGQTSTEQ